MEEFEGVEGFRKSEEQLNHSAYCIYIYIYYCTCSCYPFFHSDCKC